MNRVDSQYLDILSDIIENGTHKETRSGKVRSVFCRTMRFDLNEGLPLLTTKRVYYKGIIHELLWFLSGDTNIKYLVDNNVNIWNDDAYRHYCGIADILKPTPYSLNKTDFIESIKNNDHTPSDIGSYVLGDLGPIYGQQWRSFGEYGRDQIMEIVDKLKNNPDDRRIMCAAYNPDVLDDVALPPCHTHFQLYTRELSVQERASWVLEHHNMLVTSNDHASYETLGFHVPKRELSCSFSMRSNDFCCGNPFNIAQYAILTEMLAHVCNMSVGELVYIGNDVHVYENHVDLAMEQLKRRGSNTLPKLSFNRDVKDIDDFKFEDFIITNYNPDAAIKYPLSVG